MKRIRTIAIVMSVYLLGAQVPDIPGVPTVDLSLVDSAHAARRVAHRSAHRTAHRTARPAHANVDVDVGRTGSHRSVDVDVDVRRRASVGGVAAAIAVGTRVARLPSGCTRVVIDDVTYHDCDSVYYRPYYEGTTVVYVVVDAP